MANPKGNPQNLKSIGDRSPEERKAIASKGGKTKAERIKRKRELSEIAKAFLDIDLNPKVMKEFKAKFNVDDEMLTNRFPLIANLYGIAMDKGNTPTERMAAMKMLAEFAEESPNQLAAKNAEKAKQTQIEDDPFSASLKTIFGGDK